jgi:hypothetical protein
MNRAAWLRTLLDSIGTKMSGLLPEDRPGRLRRLAIGAMPAGGDDNTMEYQRRGPGPGKQRPGTAMIATRASSAATGRCTWKRSERSV